MNLSKNFTLEELTNSATAKNLKIDNSVNDSQIKKLKTLCNNILQPLRDSWNAPIIITSGFRCSKLNKAVGGASSSDHMFCNAADIHTLSDKPSDNKKLFDLAVQLMKEGKLKAVKQIIDEYNYNWIHISYQDGRTSKHNQILHLK